MDIGEFQQRLQVDPAVALRPPPAPKFKTGPSHRLQFVIEFVGPKTTPAALAAALYDPKWYAALGEPMLWTMSAADTEWQQMTTSTAGSYDSIALAWDLISPRGTLTVPTALNLFQKAEQFATHLNRRAIPLPHPSDIEASVSEVQHINENFDAGFSVMVVPRQRAILESNLWVWCAQLGLIFGSSEGTFDWKLPTIDQPLFSVSPLGGDEAFSLGSVGRNILRDGVLIGFNVPRCPNPRAALDGLFEAADYFARQMDGEIFDDSERPVTEAIKKELRQALAQVLQAMEKTGITPGSPDAVKLFPA